MEKIELEHIDFEYDHERQSLKFFINGKLRGGMIGKLATARFKAIEAEVKNVDRIISKSYNDGHKTKTPKI